MKLNIVANAWLLALVALVLGCAPNIKDRPTVLEARAPGPALKLNADVPLTFDTGYSRTLKRGSVWRAVGRLAEGDVYKPVDSVFTVEGAHVHEAFLVVNGGALVGFYLPTQSSFSPLTQKIPLDFSKEEKP